MENEWTPPSDAVEVKGSSSFVPPSDAVEVVKKKDLTGSGLAEPSSERLTTTTTRLRYLRLQKESVTAYTLFQEKIMPSIKKKATSGLKHQSLTINTSHYLRVMFKSV